MSKVNFVGEDLNLTKNDILNILDEIGEFWSRDRFHNAKRLVSLRIFKSLVYMTSRKEVEDLWNILIKFIDELRYQNYVAGTKGSNEGVLGVVKRSISKEIFQ